MKKMIKMSLTSSKEDNYYIGEEELKLSEKALNNFKYALYEVVFDVELDEETGETKIITVDGFALDRNHVLRVRK